MIANNPGKRKLRLAIKNILNNLTSVQKYDAGVSVMNHLEKWLLTHNHIKKIAFFINLSDEISTCPINDLLLKYHLDRIIPMANHEGSLLFIKIPLYADIKQFRFNHHLTTMPNDGVIDLKLLDAVLIPGLAFDIKGHRLGRGQGYYDKTLAHLPKKPILVGLAMDEQIVDDVPIEKHDIIMDYIATPKLGIIKCDEK